MRPASLRFVALLLAFALAWPAMVLGAAAETAKPSEPEALLVYFAALVGSRDPENTPMEGVYLSQSQLSEALSLWNPNSDNPEIKKLFMLRSLGEILRQLEVLPREGGRLNARFASENATFDLDLKVDRHRTDPTKYHAQLQIFRNGKLIQAPGLTARLGERMSMASRSDDPESRFLLSIFEVHSVPAATATNGGAEQVWRGVSKADLRALFDAPKKIAGEPPQYTDEARKARLQGVVILKVRIDANGLPGEITVLKGLPMGLTDKAIEAVRTWRFTAPIVNGEPAQVDFNLAVKFRIDEAPKP